MARKDDTLEETEEEEGRLLACGPVETKAFRPQWRYLHRASLVALSNLRSDRGKVVCLSFSAGSINIFTYPHFRCAGKAFAGFKFITALSLDFCHVKNAGIQPSDWSWLLSEDFFFEVDDFVAKLESGSTFLPHNALLCQRSVSNSNES